jgi:hypothetical protein
MKGLRLVEQVEQVEQVELVQEGLATHFGLLKFLHIHATD